MEYSEYVDRLGQRLVTKVYEGIHYPEVIPGNVKDQLDQLNQIKFHPSDVLVASFPRSGTNWVYEIIQMLMNNEADYISGVMNSVEVFPPDILSSLPPPRLFQSHLFPQHCPKQFMENKLRIVYVYRNPKDVFVSLYRLCKSGILKADIGTKMYEGEWSDFLDLMYSGKSAYCSWFDHTRAWYEYLKNTFQPHYLVCYEDLQNDLLNEIKGIANFLSTNSNDDFLKLVAEKCTFSNMMEYKQKHVPDYIKSMSRDGKSNIFFRKGKVGEWKDVMTEEQNKRFNEMYKSKMHGIDLKINLD